MVMELDAELPQRGCGNLAGHTECAAAVLKSFFNKENGCQGFGSKQCTCRHHPKEAERERAITFMDSPIVALRYIGHRKHEREKARKAEEALQLAPA